MNEKLERLNRISPENAATEFLNCCGSRRWAEKMAELRPFADVSELLEKAGQIWQNLEDKDILEAFAAHPKIGARKAAPSQAEKAAAWSQGEQSGVRAASETILDALAEANRLYENRFGYIFIVCATGKSAGEMLEICRARLSNEIKAEINIAADEQRKITEIRLKKLLETESE